MNAPHQLGILKAPTGVVELERIAIRPSLPGSQPIAFPEEVMELHHCLNNEDIIVISISCLRKASLQLPWHLLHPVDGSKQSQGVLAEVKRDRALTIRCLQLNSSLIVPKAKTPSFWQKSAHTHQWCLD